MLVQFTPDDDRSGVSREELNEAMVNYLVSIARKESRLRSLSMRLSLAKDDRNKHLVARRRQIELAAAEHMAHVVNLGREHGLDPLKHIRDLEDLELVWLVLKPLEEIGGASA